MLGNRKIRIQQGIIHPFQLSLSQKLWITTSFQAAKFRTKYCNWEYRSALREESDASGESRIFANTQILWLWL